MCRGGKDGRIKRCKVKATQKAQANLRKQVKYRADKEEMTVEAWKQANPESLQALVTKMLPSRHEVAFQPFSETRRLAEDIPALISEHIKMSKDHIDTKLSSDEQKALTGYTGFAAGASNSVLLKKQTVAEALYDSAPPWRESNAPCDFSTREDLEDYLETMDHVLSERQEEQRVLYRGIPIYRGLHEEIEQTTGKQFSVEDTDAMMEGLKAYYQPGKVFDFPSYVSTTHSAYYAADRTKEHSGTKISYYDNPKVKGIMFEMKTNAGLDVTGVSRNHSYEREVILPRDTRFRVESISLKPESYDTVSGYDYLDDTEEQEKENFTSIAVVIQMVEVDKDGNEILHADPHKPSPLNLQ
jgi:hypothetical protein